MALIRTPEEDKLKNYGEFRTKHVLIADEWNSNNGQTRDLDPIWEQRYKHEAGMIASVCKENGYGKILELGSGPGRLGQCVMEKIPNCSYSFVDKYAAKQEHEARLFKSNGFYVKDMMNSFDISDLDTDYDLIIANDFLEHIANPSDVLYKARSITKDKAGLFVSVPNWRMGHGFIYRGLFDFDNWVYCCKVHGWEVDAVGESELKCQPLPRESSESMLSDNLLDSWNWYFVCKKVV
jgi:2-polyprenyl-3-methyl-5-hydroxy-6-metoxy-1,4-benzoquinol methylase